MESLLKTTKIQYFVTLKYFRADSAWTGVNWYQNIDGDKVGRCIVFWFVKREATVSSRR